MRGSIFNILSYKIARDIRYDLFWYLVRKDAAFFDERKTGDMLSRIASDVEVLQDGLSTKRSPCIASPATRPNVNPSTIKGRRKMEKGKVNENQPPPATWIRPSCMSRRSP